MYGTNPFLERRSERTRSDQEFVKLFSPKILERLGDEAFRGAVHVFRSPPGGGKTTLLRAFTPGILRAFFNARHAPEMAESFQRLVARSVLDADEGPNVLGVLLSCASGYADLPSGASTDSDGLFRALVNCRIVLRALRNLAALLGRSTTEEMSDVTIELGGDLAAELSIPTDLSVAELVRWAEGQERAVYAGIESGLHADAGEHPISLQFDGILWLQSVRFVCDGKLIAPSRLLMIDDVHKLKRRQRTIFIEELTELRPTMAVWLAERSIVLGEDLLAPGARQGRDLYEHDLDDMWGGPRGQHQFIAFAQNVLDRRMDDQDLIPRGSFTQYLRSHFVRDELRTEVTSGLNLFRARAAEHADKPRYSEWLARAERSLSETTLDALRELYVTHILLVRDAAKRQMALELAPLSVDELADRDNSQVQGAAEIFMHEELHIPYYFGIDRVCVLATSNIDELLSIAAALYDGLVAKQILRKPELLLSPSEQERLIKEVASRKREFIPKNHAEGSRVQRLLDGIGSFCWDRTFLPNAPYAPGVTGVRLAALEFTKLDPDRTNQPPQLKTLRRVLSECVAENLLTARPSSATTGRDGGTIFYLNRTLCAHYDLPLQMGGWQDVPVERLVAWMEKGRQPDRKLRLELA